MAFYPSNNSGPSVAVRQHSPVGGNDRLVGEEAVLTMPQRQNLDSDATLDRETNARRLTHDEYTVSWICAITTESVAAQAFLDEKHEPIYALPNDSNSYTLGRMGRHNIVIAVLPEGEYGTTSAATTAVTMLNTFPNIRIGLLVGIGGGAPSPKNDVRLGDVVVSSPGGGNGGVFQYDFGKAVQGQIFEPTKHLNQPPRFLRTAVSKLRGDYLLDGHGLEARIENTLTNRPRLRKKFGRPSPDTDRLYHSNFIHPQNVEAKCQETCGHDPANLVFRNTRDEFDDGPLIHYGIIASANTLLKDASIRDALAREHDVLCLEMEAAGLMNDYPCLVIRGICDYADTHKNNEWQGYAAMVAAAYAKSLSL